MESERARLASGIMSLSQGCTEAKLSGRWWGMHELAEAISEQVTVPLSLLAKHRRLRDSDISSGSNPSTKILPLLVL
jgi:hypothetical protein